MGGPSTNNQQQIENQQVAVSQQALAQQNQQYAQQQALEAPAVSFYQGLINGQPGLASSAAAPMISQITAGQNAAIENIKNNVPQGAGQQFALSQIPIQENSQISSTLNNVVNSAYPTLANLGAGFGANAIQDLGATISGFGNASNTGNSILQAQNQAKESSLGIFGSLLGLGGELGGAAIQKSDLHLKQDLEMMDDALMVALEIPVVKFAYRSRPSERKIGVIAQDLQRSLPELVSRGADGFLQVDYAQLAAVALAAVRELGQRVKTLEEQVFYSHSEHHSLVKGR